jgi:hypothetical protein
MVSAFEETATKLVGRAGELARFDSVIGRMGQDDLPAAGGPRDPRRPRTAARTGPGTAVPRDGTVPRDRVRPPRTPRRGGSRPVPTGPCRVNGGGTAA